MASYEAYLLRQEIGACEGHLAFKQMQRGAVTSRNTTGLIVEEIETLCIILDTLLDELRRAGVPETVH